MATFYMNRRGGLTVDRDSLHASDGYKRQVEALDKLRERSMNAELREAVERIKRSLHANYMPSAGVFVDVSTVEQALRDQEEEIARLKDVVNSLRQAITAHLGGENNG